MNARLSSILTASQHIKSSVVRSSTSVHNFARKAGTEENVLSPVVVYITGDKLTAKILTNYDYTNKSTISLTSS